MSKMKKYIKIISAGMAALMVTGALSACAPKDDIPTITWYMPKPIDNMSSQQMVEDEVNKIFEKEVGARLKLVLIDEASYAEKMNVVINSGEEFDIMFSAPWNTSTSYDTNAPKGNFMDLTELVDKYGQDIKAKADPRAWDYVTYDGKVQIIPSQMKLYTEIGWVFKKDLVEKYNFDYKSVQTLEEKEKFFYLLDDERNLEDYKTRHEWYEKGYFPKDALTLNAAEAKKTGKYAVMRDTGSVTEDGSKSSANYGFPCVDQLINSNAAVSANEFRTGQAISRTSKHPEEAMKILDLVWKDPYISNTLAYGIEDVDYVYESGKGTDSPTVIPKEGGDRTWTLWHNYVGPLFDQWNSSWNSTEALQKMQEGNKNITVSKMADVQFDTQPITTELAALSEIWQASEKVLQYGAMTDFDAYVKELDEKCKAAGIDTVIDELNKQYNAAKGK